MGGRTQNAVDQFLKPYYNYIDFTDKSVFVVFKGADSHVKSDSFEKTVHNRAKWLRCQVLANDKRVAAFTLLKEDDCSNVLENAYMFCTPGNLRAGGDYARALAELGSLTVEHLSLQTHHESLKNENSEVKLRNEELVVKLEETNAEYVSLQAQSKSLESENSKVKLRNEELVVELEMAKATSSQQNKEIEELARKKNIMEAKAASLKAKCESLRIKAFDDGIIDYEPARVYLAKWSHDLQVARSREFVESTELDAITRTDSFETNTEKDFSFVDEREALSLAASTLGESGRLVMRKNDATSTSSSTKQKKLGVWDETTLAETQIGAFVVLSTDTTPPPPKVSRLPPLSPAEWRLWFDEYVPVPAALPRPRNHLLTTEDSYYIQDEISDSDREDVVDLGVGNGRIVAAQSEIQRRIFVGGVDPELRGQVWPFLFELYPWDSTHAERKKIKAKNTAEYWRMKYEWLAVAERLGHQDFETTPSDQVGQDPDADMYRDASMRVDKDVPRTDRGHPFYNDPNPPTPRPPGVGPFSPHQNILRDILITYACSYPDSDGIGYVQGQSDLLSPILIICNGDEVDAFYIFAHLMSSKKQNFLTSGTGMHNHLQTISRLLQVTDPIFHSHLSTKLDGGNFFFTFRWFLVSFKREFSFQDTCTLWEVVQTRWAAGGVNDFLYFVALAILDEHRDAIMRYLWTFDELLKYINDLAGVIPINSTLEAAELLYLRFRVRAASLGVLPVLAAEEEPSSAKNRGKAKKKKEEMPSVASELGLMEILDLIVAKEAEAREDVKGAGKRKTA
ncbi:GTPase activating protein [Rhizoclosmatium hyalinum]|nr:GTPase activating protein [Rhizoclosmatium hyalinum]